MNLKRIIKEEMDLDWMKNINVDTIDIKDLTFGDIVFIKCPKYFAPTQEEQELTVSDIYDSYRTGEICVKLTNMKNMKYPFGDDREGGYYEHINVCEHIPCDFYKLSI